MKHSNTCSSPFVFEGALFLGPPRLLTLARLPFAASDSGRYYIISPCCNPRYLLSL